jgi:hypothetical protein
MHEPTMTKRTELLSGTFLAAAKDGVHSEPCNTPGCALEIKKRNGSMRAYFRYPGVQFGEVRVARIPLGSYDQGLLKLRRICVAYEDLIAEGKSPKRYKQHVEDQQRAAGMTFREALEEFWQFAVKGLWNPKTRKHNEYIRKNHLDPMPMMDMPIESIRGHGGKLRRQVAHPVRRRSENTQPRTLHAAIPDRQR